MGKDSVLKLVVEEVITWVVGRELVVGILLLFIVDAVVMDTESASVVIEASVTGEVKDVEVVRVSVASLEVLSVMGVL